MNLKSSGQLAALLLVIGLLAACRSGASGPPPEPTLTPTPMSTPLPTIPPTVAPGSADNPVRVVLVSAASGRAANAAMDSLQTAVQDAGLTVDVETVGADRDAVQALCDAFDGPQALAFVSGLGYAATTALGCAAAPAFIAQGTGDAATRDIILIASEESEIAVLSDLQDKTFCRLSDSDLDTWLAPSLLMLAEGLPPTSTLREVVNVADLDALVDGIASGDCDAAALPRAEFERIADSEIQDVVTVLPQTVELPLGVVMVAPEMPLGVRTALLDALDAWANTPDGADALDALIGASSLVPYTSGALDDWNEFLDRTGLDFASFQD